MELKPVKRYNEPEYPTRPVVDAHPEVLRQTPRRWQRNAAILGTMASVLGLGLAGHLSARAAERSVLAGKPAPPIPRYFISEEEAAAIIGQELKQVGLAPEVETFRLRDLPVVVKPATETEAVKTVAVTFHLDQYDEKKQVGLEYVTSDDVLALQKDYPAVRAVTKYAPALQAAIDASMPKDTHLKILPATPADDKAAAQKQLRSQVQEFLNFLKGEGVI